MDINKLIIVGRLTRDPELSYTQSQTPICKFSIAVNGMKKGDVENVSFFNVTTWNKVAETCSKYLLKGRQVVLEGRIEQNRYTDKDGVNKSVVGIIANQVQFIGAKSENESRPPQQNQQIDNGIPIPEPSWGQVENDSAPFEAEVITGGNNDFNADGSMKTQF